MNKNSGYSINDFNLDIFNIDKNIKCEDLEKKLLNLCASTNLMNKKNIQHDNNKKEDNKNYMLDSKNKNKQFLFKKDNTQQQEAFLSNISKAKKESSNSRKRVVEDVNVDYDIKKITNTSENSGPNKVQEYILYRRNTSSVMSNVINNNDKSKNVRNDDDDDEDDDRDDDEDDDEEDDEDKNESSNYNNNKKKKTNTSSRNSSNNNSSNKNKNNKSGNDIHQASNLLYQNLLNNPQSLLQHLNLEDVKNFLKAADRSNNDNLPEIN